MEKSWRHAVAVGAGSGQEVKAHRAQVGEGRQGRRYQRDDGW